MNASLTTDSTAERNAAQTGPSFAAALCGFVSTTVATTALMFLLSSV